MLCLRFNDMRENKIRASLKTLTCIRPAFIGVSRSLFEALKKRCRNKSGKTIRVFRYAHNVMANLPSFVSHKFLRRFVLASLYGSRGLVMSLLIIFLWCSCASDYKLLKAVPVDTDCVERVIPKGITTSWYITTVDVLQHHLSGLLLIKEMPGGARRVVFTNEAGVTFFDFQFDGNGKFKVIYVIKQFNRKPVLNTLREDFELLLGLSFRQESISAWTRGGKVYYGVVAGKETSYFVTTPDCGPVQYLELGSKRKKKTAITFLGDTPTAPDRVTIKHFTFAMKIELTKLNQDNVAK
jgi:hypothetical protein